MKPILFSAPMVNAILSGTKTMTRRVVKPDLVQYVTDGVAGFQDEYGDHHDTVDCCPYGKVGDLLWVRETFAIHTVGDVTHTVYRADCYPDGDGVRWRPSIFMPRQYSRITLRITDVRVERLQDMKREDATAEGIGDSPLWRPAFKQLWDSINTKRGYSWDSNPWVWVVSFDKV